MKVQTLSAKNLFIQGESQAMGQSRDKNEASKVGSSSLFSREKRFALTTKKASSHEKKGFTSRAQTPHLDFHPSIGCARAHVFVIIAFLIQALGALKDQPLGVV